MHGFVECTCSRACGVDVTIRDVTIKTPDRKCDRGREWRHARKGWGFYGFEKRKQQFRFGFGWKKSIFGARRGQTSSLRRGCRTCWGSDGKVSREINCVSHVEKSHVVFFGLLYIYKHFMNITSISRIHILVVFLNIFGRGYATKWFFPL